MKKCSNNKCKNKDLLLKDTMFYKNKTHNDGLTSFCKNCIRFNRNIFYVENRQKILKYKKAVYDPIKKKE